jgi:hypothetical protein
MGSAFYFFKQFIQAKISIDFSKDSNVVLNNSNTIKFLSNTFLLVLLKKRDNYNSIVLNETTSPNKNE